MSSRYADNLGLPWSHVAEESTRFWLILCVVFAVVLPVALIIPGINLPEKERSQLEALPPQLAKVILEKKTVVKKPKEEVKKPEPEKKEIAEKKAEEKPPEVTEKPKPKIKKSPPQQTVEQAREVAQSSGLLALQDDLADMRESLDTSSLSSATVVSNSMVAKTISAKANVVNSGSALAGSGGVDTAELGVPAETVVLSQRETTVLEENEAEKVTAQSKARKKGKERGSDNIRRVFDQNKSSLFTLYHRELRKDPSLQGKVVLKITIEPNGTVSFCEIISSDLESPKLERKIASRVKLFNFGSMPVEVKTVTYPIEFFQS